MGVCTYSIKRRSWVLILCVRIICHRLTLPKLGRKELLELTEVSLLPVTSIANVFGLLISPWVRVRGCFGAPQDIRTCGVEKF